MTRPRPSSYAPGTFANLFDLSNQVALVVGGGGGLGSAIAAGLADHGARIVIADLDLAASEAAAGSCARPGREEPFAVQLDVTNHAMVDDVVGAIEQKTGRIDILINSAGIVILSPAVDFSPAQWQRVLDVNLSGPFYVTRAVGRGMIARRYGRVLSLGSVSSLLGHPDHAPYAASKGGLLLLTKVLATEWGPFGITVNLLGPTYIETNLSAGSMTTPEARAGLISKIPMGRLGEPGDLVGAAVFLCSESARFVTGQILYVDGGRTAD